MHIGIIKFRTVTISHARLMLFQCFGNILQDFIHSLKVLLGNHTIFFLIYIREVAYCIVIV